MVIDKDTVASGQHQVGKVFFANYQNLDEDLNGRKVYIVQVSATGSAFWSISAQHFSLV